MKNIYKIEKELYITNDEEIKEGDWIFEIDNSTINIADKDYYRNEFDFKIILTTDHDLIKDGVQAIDDEFLEWFVKNPGCEEIEVHHFGTCCGNQLVNHCIHCKKYNPVYKIIIPKEERKKNFYCGDEVDYDDKCLEQCDRCVNATGVDYGYLPEESQKQHLIDMMKDDEDLGLYNETSDEYLQRIKDRWTEDYTVTFKGDGEVTILHIPFKDLHTVAILLNEFLQSKGIESSIEKKSGW